MKSSDKKLEMADKMYKQVGAGAKGPNADYKMVGKGKGSAQKYNMTGQGKQLCANCGKKLYPSLP